MSEPACVLGVGLATALGQGAEPTLRALHEGRRAFRPSPLSEPFFPGMLVCAADWLTDAAPSRSAALAVTAAREALVASGISPADAPIELLVGASLGGMHESELPLASWWQGASVDVSDACVFCHGVHAVADHVADVLGPFVRVTTVSSACSSGALAVGLAMGRVARGEAKYVLAGGVDGLARITMLGFQALSALDPRGPRPFDAGRAGLGLGEGAGFLLLGPSPRTTVHLSGFFAENEAFHATQPEPSGRMIDRVSRAALAKAGLGPNDVGYVSAHGTGTEQNDRIEAAAISRIFGGDVPVSSQKGALGHTLGACGAIEAIVAVDVVATGRLPVSVGVETPMAGIRHVLAPNERRSVDAAVSNSFGFGGTGAVIVASTRAAPAAAPTASVGITATVTLGPEGLLSGQDVLSLLADATPTPSPGAGRASPLRRIDPASSLAVAVAAELVAARPLNLPRTAVVVASAFGVPDSACAFLARAVERGPKLVPPMDFPHLVPSAPASNVAIALGLGGPALAVADLSTGPFAAVTLAQDLISDGLADAVLVLAIEPESRVCSSLLSPRVTGISARGWGAAGIVVEREAGARVSFARVSRSVLPAVAPPGMRHLGWSRQGAVPGWSAAPASFDRHVGAHEAASGRALAVAAQAILSGKVDAAAIEERLPRAHGRVILVR